MQTNTIFANAVLTANGWVKDARLRLENGRIAAIDAGVAAEAGDERHDILVPGMPNLHSHAFQRAMAGLAEMRGPGDDSFWSWRSVMYNFALSMTPEQVEAVAAQLYLEMLEAGFTRVGEFHYLHHDKNGQPYTNPAEMGERIAAAAGETGLKMTLLPVFYAHSGFGGSAPNEGQRRFVSSVDLYRRVFEGVEKAVANLPDSVVGIAPHSLRAATPDELTQILPLAAERPIHIHIAEQVKEVEDCIAWSGKRPVEWLLENQPVDSRWCLIHATHMLPQETLGMAKAGAIAGLCPITEANLGDGIFPGVEFLSAGGRYGVGSDQNVLIGVSDELRQLEYSLRLATRSRNVAAQPNQSTGRALFDGALAGGAVALGAKSGIAVGVAADFVSLNRARAPYLKDDAVLDGWIFAGNVIPDCVWVHGVKQVEGGRHVRRERIEQRFLAAMKQLTDTL
ncbi:formimidoylglutamate deiminase [Rhizobium sp. YJ-22]|uniref:formimidoylglutamate deiminase n=1 Tax=Rhizobium sp. YJ-22 TaxID=3037556 RepID=UPI002412ADCD|nr:formimidoylglutamate deiminase [Rhizobium sp. YJ-22]MDG3579105.1 formimidoylglutamate deiminase [Rhizobium sp. YJ-22]